MKWLIIPRYFFVKKLGQSGHYRGIRDGKAGGQNDVCVGYPCKMTSPDHMLSHLYTNGWYGLVDTLKFSTILKLEKREIFHGFNIPKE